MKQLASQSLASAEFVRREWRASVPPDTTVEEMIHPGFWGHVAAQLRTGDEITVVAEDNSFYYKFFVRFARRLEASVSLLQRVELEPAAVTDEITAQYEVKFRGQRSKWTILRGKDVLRDGFESEGQAKAYLDDHLKAMAA
jgi:hypothetical protein